MGRNTTSSPPARASDAGSKATPKPAATKAATVCNWRASCATLGTKPAVWQSWVS
ncbi:hypothetical protein D3C81_2336690 [compost metagenome]